MGKKGSWFSAIKRVFMHHSKEKQTNEFESKNPKETKKKIRGQRYGETKSFIPLFREPSSIEKILGEADEQNIFSRPTTPFEPPKTPSLVTPKVASPKAASPRKATSTRVTSPRAASIRVTSPRASSQRVPYHTVSSSRDFSRHKEIMSYMVEPTFQYRHLSATKIQTAYRGYMARRSFRALRGLVRLQGVVRGQNVRRQTANTLKMMQQLVRVQAQVRSQRIQMLERQTREHQAYNFDKEQGTALAKWDLSQSEAGNQEDWDYSTLTKEEREARMQKKMEAALKRQRTMAYAYSHQSSKSNAKLAQASVPDVFPGGFPSWNWLESQIPPTNNPLPEGQLRTFNLTPPRRTPEPKASPRTTYKSPHHFKFDNYESTTPTSTRSMAPLRSKHFMPTPTRKTPTIKYPKKDNDSLMSCPPYSIPNYMTPTASAKARANSNPKERFPGTPGKDSKRRFSFPFTPIIGSLKWNNNRSSMNKDLGLKKELEKEESYRYDGDFSVDSTVSMPAAVGRKPFNRFV